MSRKPLHGVSNDQEVLAAALTKDVRPWPRKMAEWLRIPSNLSVLLLMNGGLSFQYPEVGPYTFLVSVVLLLWGLTRMEEAPLKLPTQSKLMDPHELRDDKPSKAQGIFFLGNDMVGAKEVWLSNSDCRQHFLVIGTTGSGKSLPLDAPVHTPTGWRRMGDLCNGGRVSTPDGRSGDIAGYYPQGILDIARVSFEDGRTAEVCPDHLWEVRRSACGANSARPDSQFAPPPTFLATTRQLADLLSAGDGGLSIRLADPVEKPAVDLEMDPYELGVVVAKSSNMATVGRLAEAEGRGALAHAPQAEGTAANTPADDRSFDLSRACCQGSTTQRWALLQGLMDTAGGVDSSGVLWFSTDKLDTARTVQELVWSLGGVAKLTTLHNKQCNHDGWTPAYRLALRHAEPSRLFSLPRKIAQASSRVPESWDPGLRVRDIEFGVRRAEAACILVDHPDHLFITRDYVVTHNTELLLGFGANALCWGSGFLFCDGKGDVALYAKVFAMARRFGREADILVLNFMTGNEDVRIRGGKVRSNTINPFATGSSDGLTQLVVGLMDDTGGDGAMWKGRATAMLTGVMRALTWMRDEGIVDLNVGAIREYLNLRNIMKLADAREFPEMPPDIRKSVKSYLTSLPGYQEEKKDKQAQTTLDQHGYLEMQFTRILGSLADVYGHIFDTPMAEVDMHDVVLNRRILVIMLPALEKAGLEIANLGKIVVATLKGMMGSTLGSSTEGSWEEVVENRATNSPSPFLCIMDEVGYYTVDGMALMAAQARSLGFSLVFASQDIPAMKRLNEKEAASIIANTNTKIVMRTEEVSESAKLAIDAAGKATRVRVGGYEHQDGVLGGGFGEADNTGFEDADRINVRGLKAQEAGEMHVLHKDAVIRAKAFYANIEASIDVKTLKLRPNHFIMVAKPTLAEMQAIQKGPEIMAALADPAFPDRLEAEAAERIGKMPEMASAGDEIAVVAQTIDKILAVKRPMIEASAGALALVMRQISDSIVGGLAESVRSAARGTVPPGGPFSGDMDFEDAHPADRRGDRGSAGRDPYGPGGRGFVDPPDRSMPQRRQQAPRPPPRLDPGIPHGTSVDGGAIRTMSDRLSGNDLIMRSLHALDFDGERTPPAEVSRRIDTAIAGAKIPEPADPERLAGQVEAFDRSAAAANALPPIDDDIDDQGGDTGDAGGSGNELVSSFLEQLLADDDDRS